jgi:hypothetical protein
MSYIVRIIGTGAAVRTFPKAEPTSRHVASLLRHSRQAISVRQKYGSADEILEIRPGPEFRWLAATKPALWATELEESVRALLDQGDTA